MLCFSLRPLTWFLVVCYFNKVVERERGDRKREREGGGGGGRASKRERDEWRLFMKMATDWHVYEVEDTRTHAAGPRPINANRVNFCMNCASCVSRAFECPPLACTRNYYELAVQPGVARAFSLCSPLSLRSCAWLRSTLSLRSCAWLRSALSLRSCAPLNFVASLLWLRSASSLPDWSLNPQITPLRNFSLLWTSAGLKQKGRFRMVIQALLVTSSPGGSLPFCISKSSPCRAETCFFSVQSVSLFQSLSVTGGFALLVVLRPNFCHYYFSQKPHERSESGARKKRQGSSLAWLEWAASFKGHVRRTDSVLAWCFLDKRSITVDCWILKLFYPTDPRNTDRPTHESLRKHCPIFGKAYMFK